MGVWVCVRAYEGVREYVYLCARVLQMADECAVCFYVLYFEMLNFVPALVTLTLLFILFPENRINFSSINESCSQVD